jgi:hypothetical protein
MDRSQTLNNSNIEPESFEVFLCHNSEDKPEIRRIADDLIKRGIKPWLDEREIMPGTAWQSALEDQIAHIRSAAIFIGKSGIGPWQNMEIRAFINEFVERGCPVIPAILPSAQTTPPLPILLKNLHYVDFRVTDPDPMSQLLWGITGKKPTVQAFPADASEGGAALLSEKVKQLIEIRLPGNLDAFSDSDKEMLLAGLSAFLKIEGEIKIVASRPGSTRLFLELPPEDADKIYAAAQSGQLENLGITEARIYPSLADPPDQEQRAQLLILLSRVQEFWINGVLKQSLYHEVLISLGKRAMDEAVEPPWNSFINLPKWRQQLALSDNRIDTVFDATGLLLILGEPGSGKTTTLLELVSKLIARAETDPKERIPAVLNLSSWKTQQTLADWMAEKLGAIYRVPVKLARAWLDKGYLIPLLDGLDEVKTEHQANCAAALNAYITDAEPPGLVVCSRLTEYQWLPERLKMNGAICIRPLTQEQIDGYFAAIGAELEPLRTAIKEDSVLQELAQSPLMLNIMSMACRSASPDCLIDQRQSVEVRRTQIFAAYVDQMFLRKASLGQDFPKEKIIFWLSCLAKKMTAHSQSAFFVENLQPNYLDSWRQKAAYRAISSLIFGLILALIVSPTFGLFFAVVVGLFARSDSPVKNGIICGLMGGLMLELITELVSAAKDESLLMELMGLIFFGLIFGLIAGAGIGTLNSIKVIETVNWSWKSFFKRFPVFFLIGGLIVGLPTWLSYGPNKAISDALRSGLILGLIAGFIGGFIGKIREDKTRPNQGIILTLKNGLFIGFCTTLIVGLILGLIEGMSYTPAAALADRPRMGPTLWLTAGLFLGLIVGLNRGLGAVIKHYVLRFVLWCSGRMPFRLIPFLDYCARLILLKKVGSGYIFIHRMLLEHFARLRN